MSNGVNRFTGLGNLAADPDLRFAQGGGAVLNFRIGVTTERLVKEEKKETTAWINCVVWGKRAEALQKILAKGTRVLVEGEVRTGSYEKDGAKFNTFEVSVDTLVLFGGGKAGDKSDRRDENPAPQQSARSRREAAPEEKAPWE